MGLNHSMEDSEYRNFPIMTILRHSLGEVWSICQYSVSETGYIIIFLGIIYGLSYRNYSALSQTRFRCILQFTFLLFYSLRYCSFTFSYVENTEWELLSSLIFLVSVESFILKIWKKWKYVIVQFHLFLSKSFWFCVLKCINHDSQVIQTTFLWFCSTKRSMKDSRLFLL